MLGRDHDEQVALGGLTRERAQEPQGAFVEVLDVVDRQEQRVLRSQRDDEANERLRVVQLRNAGAIGPGARRLGVRLNELRRKTAGDRELLISLKQSLHTTAHQD